MFHHRSSIHATAPHRHIVVVTRLPLTVTVVRLLESAWFDWYRLEIHGMRLS